jgi:hypothetical protein
MTDPQFSSSVRIDTNLAISAADKVLSNSAKIACPICSFLLQISDANNVWLGKKYLSYFGLVSKLANLFNGGHILAEDDSVHGLQLAG